MDLCKPLAPLYIPTQQTKLIVKATITTTTLPSVLIYKVKSPGSFLVYVENSLCIFKQNFRVPGIFECNFLLWLYI